MKTQKSNTNFWRFIEKRIANLETEERWGAARNYAKAERSLKLFCDDKKLDLKDITSDFIVRYNRFLFEKGLVRNSISQYNRVLRAVYNEAVYQELITDMHPFKKVYTGIDKTTKRAIPEAELAKVATFQTNCRTIEMARDMFLFSYATYGMTFVDMAYLKKSDVGSNSMVYVRRKTGTRIKVKLEPETKSLIRKYSCMSEGSDYVFPILGQHTGKDEYKRLTCALTEYNRALKKISELTCLKYNLSSYVSRHSWATTARNSGADISTVSEALGHQSENTTRIYLAEFDTRKVDKVNRHLIDRIWKNSNLEYEK